MPIEVTMPRLSDTMEQGTVVAWNVKEGDAVAAGDVLGDIETDKATMELQNFDDGVVAAILVKEGETVEVGKAIVVLAEEGEDPAEVRAQFAAGSGAAKPAEAKAAGGEERAKAAPAGVAEAPSQEASPNGHADGHEAGAGVGGRVFASPLARKIAEERGLDLGAIEGTGPSGRIVKRDVEAAAAGGARAEAPAREREAAPAVQAAPLPPIGAELRSETVPLNNMRATIAKRLVESKQQVPHYQVTLAVNMDPLLALRKQLNDQLESQGVKLSVNDFLVRACALAMHQHPHVNSSWGKDGKSVVLHAEVNVGVAIAIDISQGGGLVVGTIRGADSIGLRQISAETKRLAKKARDRGLTIEEQTGATFTISNLGMFEVEHFTAIINPPNAAILAVGAAVEKPVVRDGQIVVGHEMQMTMSSDHRIIDGAMAAQYLQTVKRLLEAPATLLV